MHQGIFRRPRSWTAVLAQAVVVITLSFGVWQRQGLAGLLFVLVGALVAIAISLLHWRAQHRGKRTTGVD